MATASNNQKPQDVAPPLDDDIDPAPAPDLALDELADPLPSAPEKPEKPEDPRAAAVRRYREMRAQEKAAPEPESEPEAAADEAEPEAPAEPVVAAAPAPPAAPAAPPVADEPTYTLVVDGRPVTMKASEVIAKAQIAVASDNRLDEAKRLLQEARALRGSNDAQDHPPGADDQQAQPTDPEPRTPARRNQPAIDEAKLEEIVERIQIGDKTEGRQAMAELIGMIATVSEPASMDPAEVGRMVQTQLAQHQIKTEIATAAETYRDKYGALVSDPDMLHLSLNRLMHEVRQDLEQSGRFSTKDLNSATHDDLMNMHNAARIHGLRVRPYTELFDKVGTDMATKFGALAPAAAPADPPASRTPTPAAPALDPRIADRVDRKRAAAPQPRTAGVRASTVPQQQTRSRGDVVQDMRRARGFK